MKKIFFGFVAAFSLFAFAQTLEARSIDRTAVVATVDGQEFGIEQIALLADGRLQVKKTDAVVVTAQLSPLLTKKLLSDAVNLSLAKVVESHFELICMMMPQLWLSRLSVSGYDSTTRTFDSQLRLVLTDLNCYMADKTMPEVESDMKAAEKFREVLVVLALNSI
ncbi:MAG: hypothetical protein JNJ49_14330 [Bdellovibrionaceae bacterium]|nr:hypothetical protein [Pseudobdellovibrionaceae bacterium]